MSIVLPPWLGALLGGGLALVTAMVPPMVLRIRGAAAFASAALVCGSGAVVVLFVGLSLIGQLNQTAFFPAHAVMASGWIAVWIRQGRPRPRISPLHLDRWLVGARAHPFGAVTLALAAAALVIQLYVGLRVAPSNWDSMTYHLARVGYWLTHETAIPLEHMTIRQAASGPNAEFLQGWTILVTGTDRLANSIQWVALIGTAGVIFSGSRLLGHRRAASATAGGLFVLLPQPLLQATTTQNDLIVSFFIVAMVFFTVRGLRTRALADLAVGGAAFGLAFGTKGSTGLALPALLLLAGAALMHYRPPARVVASAAAACTVGFLLLGSFSYVTNLINDGTLSGGLNDQLRRETAIPTNFVRNAWTFVDSPGAPLPWADVALPQLAHSTVGRLENERFSFTVDSSVNEDTSAFGLLGLALMVLAVVTALKPGTSTPRRLLAGGALLYLLIFAATVESTPYKGRTLMPVIAIAAPLLAGLRPPGRSFALGLAVINLFPVLLVNYAKPLVTAEGTPNILAADRVHQQTIMKRPHAEENVQLAVRSYLARFPGERQFGFVGLEDSYVYPFFARRFDHTLTPMRREDVTRSRLAEMGLEGAIFANIPPPEGLRPELLAPAYWVVLTTPERRPGSQR